MTHVGESVHSSAMGSDGWTDTDLPDPVKTARRDVEAVFAAHEAELREKLSGLRLDTTHQPRRQSMTYAELAEYIGNLTVEQQGMEVTVYVRGVDEFYPLDPTSPVRESEQNDVLDEDNPYLVV